MSEKCKDIFNMMFEKEQNAIQVTYFTFFMETWEIKAAIFPRENSRGKLVKLYDSSRESAYTYTFHYHGAHSETKRSFCANTNILKEEIPYENYYVFLFLPIVQTFADLSTGECFKIKG